MSNKKSDDNNSSSDNQTIMEKGYTIIAQLKELETNLFIRRVYFVAMSVLSVSITIFCIVSISKGDFNNDTSSESQDTAWYKDTLAGILGLWLPSPISDIFKSTKDKSQNGHSNTTIINNPTNFTLNGYGTEEIKGSRKLKKRKYVDWYANRCIDSGDNSDITDDKYDIEDYENHLIRMNDMKVDMNDSCNDIDSDDDEYIYVNEDTGEILNNHKNGVKNHVVVDIDDDDDSTDASTGTSTRDREESV